MTGQAAIVDQIADLPEYVLLRYQIRALEDSHTTGLYVAEKSRRTGFTYAFAPDSVLEAAAEERPQNVYYIAYNMDMTREFIGYCADFARRFNEVHTAFVAEGKGDDDVALDPNGLLSDKDGFIYERNPAKGLKAFRIDFPNGKHIAALSSLPRSLRGKQGIVIIDEAAFHDNLDELLKAALALLMWGGRVIVISTHDGADNPFNELIEMIRAGKRAGIVHTVTLKTALEQGLYQRICLRTGQEWSPEREAQWVAELRAFYGDAAEEELDVQPRHGSGTFLARSTITRAMSENFRVVRLTCPAGFELTPVDARREWLADWLIEHVAPLVASFDRGRRSFFGQDFARSGDGSPIAFGQHDALGKLLARFILELRNVPFTDQSFVLEWIVERLPLFAAGKMDARGNGQANAEAAQMKWGFDRIEAVMASDNTYLQFMPLLQGWLVDNVGVLPFDEATIEDLRMIKKVNGVPKIPGRSTTSKADGAKGKRHGDNAIALMHLVAAAESDLGPIEFFSAGARTASTSFVVTDTGFGTVRRVDSMGGY